MLYDISINPPIISVLTIMFMICMEMLLTIYINIDFEKLQKAEDIKTRILLLISISSKALVLFFLLVNIVILYIKL
jgi:hypothetical protein